MKNLKVYCAHPISGLTWDEVVNYYNGIKEKLETIGLSVFQPMTGKGEIRTEISERFQPLNFKSAVASNHAIFERDQWMVRNSDILYLDLTGAELTSIGCMMELAWASLLGKYTVVVMDKENIHRHAFVVEAADIVFENADTALVYLEKMVNQTI